jgi:hypothetical protein
MKWKDYNMNIFTEPDGQKEVFEKVYRGSADRLLRLCV